MTRNKLSRRKESDPVWRRMYLLGKIEGAKARLMKQVSDLPANQGAKQIDGLLAAAFCGKGKS